MHKELAALSADLELPLPALLAAESILLVDDDLGSVRDDLGVRQVVMDASAGHQAARHP